jgi:hypothetical protein
MPLPVPSTDQINAIETAAETYLQLAIRTPHFMVVGPDETAIRRALLDLDAAVLRLYNLSPALERELLSIFGGAERLGVGCTFRGYPPGWSSRPIEPSTELPGGDRPIWERIAELAAAQAVEGLRTDARVTVVEQSRATFDGGLNRYKQFADKEWSLTDCVSFELMSRDGIAEALTDDHHFEQGGVRRKAACTRAVDLAD